MSALETGLSSTKIFDERESILEEKTLEFKKTAAGGLRHKRKMNVCYPPIF